MTVMRRMICATSTMIEERNSVKMMVKTARACATLMMMLERRSVILATMDGRRCTELMMVDERRCVMRMAVDGRGCVVRVVVVVVVVVRMCVRMMMVVEGMCEIVGGRREEGESQGGSGIFIPRPSRVTWCYGGICRLRPQEKTNSLRTGDPANSGLSKMHLRK